MYAMHSVLIIYFIFSRSIWSYVGVEYYYDFLYWIFQLRLFLCRSSNVHVSIIYIYKFP